MAVLYGYVGHRNAISRAANPRVYTTLFTLAQIVLILVLVTSLGYIAASAALPMQEPLLLAFDRALGSDFRTYLLFGERTAGNRPRACPCVRLHILAAVLVRDGTTRVLDAYSLAPLLTFPRFHAITAVLCTWAVWPLRWLRLVGVLWNAVVLLAPPIGGGHFFIDVIAGVVVALSTIYATHRLGNYLARGHSQMRQTVLLPSHASANGPIAHNRRSSFGRRSSIAASHPSCSTSKQTARGRRPQVVGMSMSNQWAELAATYLRTRDAHGQHESAKTELKILIA
ncbi:phosphatase PAP2 family protein [Bradyrhizobium sp. CIR3A]|uniref:phosphatase PAP2 family protein n=1 Tax=Bradyrhizobium sp. CIR3A TaxID=2663838 RepID=UPI0017E0C79B|nr:hypothetical protein [Bradyrhizobium sp. CIR3A]